MVHKQVILSQQKTTASLTGHLKSQLQHQPQHHFFHASVFPYFGSDSAFSKYCWLKLPKNQGLLFWIFLCKGRIWSFASKHHGLNSQITVLTGASRLPDICSFLSSISQANETLLSTGNNSNVQDKIKLLLLHQEQPETQCIPKFICHKCIFFSIIDGDQVSTISLTVRLSSISCCWSFHEQIAAGTNLFVAKGTNCKKRK